MNQEDRSSSVAAPAEDDDKLFGRSRQSRTTDLSPPPTSHVESNEEGEMVRDDELITVEAELGMQDSFATSRDIDVESRVDELRLERYLGAPGRWGGDSPRPRRFADPPPVPPRLGLEPRSPYDLALPRAALRRGNAEFNGRAATIRQKGHLAWNVDDRCGAKYWGASARGTW